MTRFRFSAGALVAGAAVSLAGCATQPLIPPSAAIVAAQGETSLELAYNVAAKAYLKRAATMDPALKAKVKTVLIQAYEALRALSWAQTLGTAAAGDLDAQVKATAGLIGEAKTLLGIT